MKVRGTAAWTILVGLVGCSPKPPPPEEKASMKMTDEDWKKKLTPEQFYICRLKGTEPPDSGKYYEFFEAGTYKCVACGTELFGSDTKYKSHCGWPSFWAPIRENAVSYDAGAPSSGAEIMCRACGSHLGHVFHDGPPPTGLRY